MPALNNLDKDFFEVIVDPLSEDFVNNHYLYDYHVVNLLNKNSELFWQEKISDFNTVIATTSSPHINIANCKLIEIGKRKNIPTLGFLDHWKGLDRFYNDEKKLSYLPDWLGVIDNLTRERLHQANIIPLKTKTVGHPWLEYLFSKINNTKDQSITKKIVIISQPDLKNEFKSIFVRPNISAKTLDFINIMESKGYESFYRPHPKEIGNGFGNLPIDKSNFSDVLTDYDIYIGFDSMLLIEAHMMGKYVVVINFENTEKMSDQIIPFAYGKSMYDIDSNNVYSFLKNENNYNKDVVFSDSIKRTQFFIEEFLDCYS